MPKKIGIVEDEGIVALDISNIVNKLGYETAFIADSGEKVLILVKENEPDAILMDINLGSGMSGKETTGRIKDLIDYKEIPIVAITAFAMQGDKDEFMKAGCTHYISKPFNRNTIVSLMKEVLQKQNQIV